MSVQRVTIRNIDSETIDEVREVAVYNEMSLGEAVTEALQLWLDSLPIVEPD